METRMRHVGLDANKSTVAVAKEGSAESDVLDTMRVRSRAHTPHLSVPASLASPAREDEEAQGACGGLRTHIETSLTRWRIPCLWSARGDRAGSAGTSRPRAWHLRGPPGLPRELGLAGRELRFAPSATGLGAPAPRLKGWLREAAMTRPGAVCHPMARLTLPTRLAVRRRYA